VFRIPHKGRLGVLLIVCAALLAGCGGNSTPSPTHVTAVFFDGVNHGDYRQTCQLWVPARKNVTRCEQGLTSNFATGLLFGAWGGYKVIPHTAKVWAQPYQGRHVELAIVRAVYRVPGADVQYVIVHLKRVDGRWLVWYLTQ
jgi:hypothetical protein